MRAGAPVFSLVVCTLGREKTLVRLLRSIAGQRQPLEVILVDQNAPGVLDAAIAPFRSTLEIRHLRSGRGLSQARNLGIRHARGEFLSFPDDDCWFPPGVLDQVVAIFGAKPGVEIVLGRTVDESGRESLGQFRHASGPVSKRNVWSSGTSSGLFVRRAMAQRIGFDEELGLGSPTQFQSGEETDFVLRAVQHGAHAWFERGLSVGHGQVDDRIGAEQMVRARSYSAGFGRVLRKHRYGLGYLGYRTGRSAGRAVLALAVLDLPRCRYKLAWALGTVRGYFASK